MANILITGAAGFIGQQVMRTALEEGHNVGALDVVDPDLEGIVYKQANIASGKQVYDAFRHIKSELGGIDAIIHLAALFNYSKKPSQYKAINVDGTRNVAKAAWVNDVEFFINMGAVAEYTEGAGPDDRISEDTPLHPFEDYGKTKQMAEELLFEEFNSRPGFNMATFRACMVYGLFSQNSYIAEALKMLKNPVILCPMNDTTNSYVHTIDMARAFLHCLEYPEKVFKRDAKYLSEVAYNLGDDLPVSERTIIKHNMQFVPTKHPRVVLPIIPSPVFKMMAKNVEFMQGLVKNQPILAGAIAEHAEFCHVVDNRKFKDTGFEYSIPSIYEGMPMMIEWFKENGHL